LVVTPGINGYSCDWADWMEPTLIGPKGSKKLTELKWRKAAQGWGQTLNNKNVGGGPLKVGGAPVSFGIGTHSPSTIAYDIGGMGFTRFKTRAGLDNGGTDQAGGSEVEFLIFKERVPASVMNAARDGIATGSADRGSGWEAAAEGLADFTVAPGLDVALFASEPRVRNPTNLDIDHRSRIWVAEGVNYRGSFKPWGMLEPKGDRIVILEDSNDDGAADKETVFYQDPSINAALGVCVLGNKVIVSCSPHIFVLTDSDGDDRADKRELLFTGIAGFDHDHAVHAAVFGPDGKLYFNFGNAGKQLRRPTGKLKDALPLHGLISKEDMNKFSEPVIDLAGNEVTDRRKPYQHGMVFRCNLSGSDVETLGWNFRNNYEVAVDSFGTMWQSDNDDDGNKGVRINYVMAYGNFGYRSEVDGAAWKANRTGWNAEIPLRHWHQNDPGVVPNLLQTGGGSPTGICVYEGTLLPVAFRGQMIHCDAGPGVVRAYPTTVDGAGYKATSIDILTSKDSWFRPADVCVAPDGSIYVADWNDAGVGGHNMADRDPEKMRGRIYRVAPKGFKPQRPNLKFDTPRNLVAALESPNQSARFLAHTKLVALGETAEDALKRTLESSDGRYKARGLYILSTIRSKQQAYMIIALKDTNPDVRVTGVRIARQYNDLARKTREETARQLDRITEKLNPNVIPGSETTTFDNPYDVANIVEQMIADPSPRVRRECAIALHGNKSEKAAGLWVKLAAQHDGKDRWQLEALGIGAAGQEDKFFAAWLKQAHDQWNTPAGRDIVWRSRSKHSAALLAKLVIDKATPKAEKNRYLRAMDFIPKCPEKDAALAEIAISALQ
jgi:putative membrane-bound dehydrogenase-like protein